MRQKSRLLTGLLTGAAFVVMMSSAQAANIVTGSIWENDSAGASDATPANVPLTTPSVTFSTASPIDFQSGNLYTIGEFLSSGNGSTILTGSTHLGDTLDNTIFNFTGQVTVTNGESFTVGHDDGVTLIIDGITVINAPGPTSFSPTTETYTGPSGTFAFQLVYGECCGAPGDLEITLPLSTPVPEPASLAILGAALLGFGAVRRWKSNA